MKVGWVWALALVSEPVSAQVRTGAGADALPAIGNVAVAERPAARITTALELGYQLIEPLARERAAHHGGTATLGVGAPLGDWISVGLAMHGLAMVHPDDDMGNDTSANGYPVIEVRILDTRDALSYGASVRGLFPGRDAPSIDFAATTVLATGLLTYEPPDSPWACALNLGYRLDNSAVAAPPLATLRQGDRTALGASSFDAVTVGVAAARSHGPWLWFGEVSGELLYNAPRVSTSPLRVGIGARYAATSALQLELRSRVGLSTRAGFDAQDYQPFEPRLAVFFGPRITWGGADDNAAAPAIVAPVREPLPQPRPLDEPTAPVIHDLVGVVTDRAGAPLAQVSVTASVGAWSQTVETAADGSYKLTAVPVGDVELVAQTVDYEPAHAQVRVAEDASVVTAAPLELEVQVLGAQVEGVVLGFDGEIPTATITLTPGERTCETDADGKFKLEVGPGEYSVKVSAPGYASQTRTVTVQPQGVVIVNVDLRTR